MKMELGEETKEQIVLKLRAKLDALLCEHKVKLGNTTHMILLGELNKIVEENIDHERY